MTSSSKQIPPNATLRTCPNGHYTCFYRDCPVCRAEAEKRKAQA